MCLLALTGCVSMPDAKNTATESTSGVTISETGEKESPLDTYQSHLDESTKVDLARNRRSQLDDIRKGDYMMTKHNPEAALGFYLPVLEKLPEDVVLEKKIAMAYFLMKDWRNAYAHFIRVPFSELSQDEQSSVLFALFYDEHPPERSQEIEKLPLSVGDKEYITIMNGCYGGAEACFNALHAYSGSETRVLDLQKIKDDAPKISPDVNYRDFMLATKLYEQKMYRIAGMIASEILARDPTYIPVKKLRGFALFELGKYNEARDILVSYLELRPDDTEVIVRLGEVFTFL